MIPIQYFMNEKQLNNYIIDLIIKVNIKVVNQTNEPHIIQDRGKLESVVSSCYYSNSTLERASRVLRGIVLAHAFIQGNKRTAFLVANIMLGRKPKFTVHQMSKKIKKWDIETIMKKI